MADTKTQNEEAVLIFLDGQGLDDAVYRDYDLSTLEGRIIELIEQDGIGELDGHETGPEHTTIYLYGPDAEALFSRVRNVLIHHPLCKNSRVVIRKGGPGSTCREVAAPFS